MFEFETKSVTLQGKKFTFRELSVEENDACVDAARQPNGDIDARAWTRFAIIKTIQEPKLDSAELSKLPNKVYLRMAEVINELNSYLDEEEEPGNDSSQPS